MRKKIGNAFAVVRIILQGALELILALLVVYGLIVTIGQGIALNQPSNEGNVEVFVRTNGVHTELCLPTDHGEFCWTNVLPVDDFNAPESIEYLSVGWGDKGFFLETPTWDELEVSTAFNALFVPSRSAMHVAYESKPMESQQCKSLRVTEEQYEQLVRYVRKSFAEEQGKVVLIAGKGYGLNDNFYEAEGAYHLFNTCNTWTNQALKSASLHAALFAALPDGVMNQL